MEVIAHLKNIRMSPRKVRLVVDTIRGKRVNEALAILRFLPKAAAEPVLKVVKSVAANAENNYNLDPNDLVIRTIFSNEGSRVKRLRARPQGRANRIIHRYSHVTVIVSDE